MTTASDLLPRSFDRGGLATDKATGSMKIVAVDRTEVPPLAVSARMPHEIMYYTAASGAGESLPRGEHRIDLEEAAQILDDGCVRVVSPLAAQNAAEIEISEDAERLLEWAIEYGVQHIRLAD